MQHFKNKPQNHIDALNALSSVVREAYRCDSEHKYTLLATLYKAHNKAKSLMNAIPKHIREGSWAIVVEKLEQTKNEFTQKPYLND